MKLERETALIEAILFLENEPMDLKSLSKISGIGEEPLKEILDQLGQALDNPAHGLCLEKVADAYLLTPKKVLWDYLKQHYAKKQTEKISRAAMEALSIIAYAQPITRAELDSLRGVSSQNVIRQLLQKELIKEVGKKDVPGKPPQYGTTKEFLKLFRLKSISDLPKLDEQEADRFELKS